jgi:hypothetical protein
MRKNAFSCCKYPSVGFRVSPSTAIKPKKNGTNTMNEICEIEVMLNAKANRRVAAEDRYLIRLERKEAAAETLIGEVCRNGKMVNYINQIDRNGRMTGKTIEGSKLELVRYCIRNHYV